ncbi:tyrosine-type recombinase/integrase [Rudanella lutea]|uniref:tyrosine-type recombinase/integrase n=1 Tax=Rudanella lutea TaxID=451374 RepID=UPI001FE01C54|nr:tyrosine-type recombinase/integrase [Rudanella lutea]
MKGLRKLDGRTQQGLGAMQSRLTVSQLIRYFATDLPKSSNYPRHARAFVDDCLQKNRPIDGVSFAQYTAYLPPNRVSPIRKFMLFFQQIGQPTVVPDPSGPTLPPAMNELVLRFIRDAKNLRGDRSKETYTKALNAFFAYVDGQLHLGQTASLSGQTVADFVHHLKAEDYSPFTVNLYLSAVKQLAVWCIRKRENLGLNGQQINELRDISDIRGLAIERTFYKDSLEANERRDLLAVPESARDLAIMALLSLEGLRTVEVTRLRLGDLDFDRGQLRVLGKGKHTRKPIKFFAECRQAVEAFLRETERWPIVPARQNESLFDELKTHQIRYVVDKYLRQQGLKRKGMSAHSLRHTAGQLLLESGVSLEHVQQHLRHETMETTQFYTKKQTQKTYLDQMPD